MRRGREIFPLACDGKHAAGRRRDIIAIDDGGYNVWRERVQWAHRKRDSRRETAMAMSGQMAEEDTASHGRRDVISASTPVPYKFNFSDRDRVSRMESSQH